ncbi:MAG: restriction endonuclease subunit S [Caldilineales bacterium]|nr:restriction endonuclease subunit S [Caldilineales bacterium]
MSVNKRELPKGWRSVKLGDVANYINGRAFKPEDWVKSGLPIIRIENLTSENAPFNFYDLPVEERYYVQDGDLLISWSASLDAFIWQRGKAILNQHIFKVEEDTSIVTRRFLYHVARFVMTSIRAQVHGATMQHITKGKFEAIEIPLPPLPEQKRIVAILDEKLAAVERARAAAQAQLEAAQALPAAYLRQVFESEDAKGWPKKRLGDTADLLPAKSIALAGDTRVQAITTACLTEAGFDPNGIKPGIMWATDAAECAVSRGEVLIARSNTEELVGRVSVFPGYPKDVVASDLTIRIWPNGEYFSSDFLSAYLSYLYLTGFWRTRAGGASSSMKKITRSHILNLDVPIPSQNLQADLIKQLNVKMGTVRKLKSELATQTEVVDAMPVAILRQAFAGEL